MYDVPIPESLYRQAADAARAAQVSVEQFVAEAVRLRLDDLEGSESVTLSPEQVTIIRRSQADIKAGKGLTIAQAEKSLAAKKAAWLQSQH